jgi:DNA polymerase III subunit delta'
MAPAETRTRGQPRALEAVARMVAGAAPHALLIVGPSSVGKTTLALDLAAGLLCTAADPADRPCRACRGCRLVDDGNHPDLHRIAPDGAGGQISIGQIRTLASELALLPVEGGARVAVVESAQRLNEDAQNALLKTLEEPPAGVTIVLCSEDEDRLLPTIRSRCARIRLGSVSSRAIENLLAELGLADAPASAALARATGGRPGLAIAYAHAPAVLEARRELTRTLLDLLSERPARRLEIGRQLLALAANANRELAAARSSPALIASVSPAEPGEADIDPPAPTPAAARGPSPSDRRNAAAWLIGQWRDLARDLAVAGLDGAAGIRDTDLMDELLAVAPGVDQADAVEFLARLADADAHLEANVNPELEIDVLVLAWPRVRNDA